MEYNNNQGNNSGGSINNNSINSSIGQKQHLVMQSSELSASSLQNQQVAIDEVAQKLKQNLIEDKHKITGYIKGSDGVSVKRRQAFLSRFNFAVECSDHPSAHQGDVHLLRMLRWFTSSFILEGETQEQDRVLFAFSQRYFDCTGGIIDIQYADLTLPVDSIHQLIYSIILLNTDLTSVVNAGGTQMKQNQYVENTLGTLQGDGANALGTGVKDDQLKSVLEQIYVSIKKQPILQPKAHTQQPQQSTGLFRSWSMRKPSVQQQRPAISPSAFSLDGSGGSNVRDFVKVSPYKEGYIAKKSVYEQFGKKSFDRRWVQYFARLLGSDLVLFQSEKLIGHVPLRHAMISAIPAGMYPGHQFLVQIITLYGAVILIDSKSEVDQSEWCQAMLYWAAMESREPLTSGVGNIWYGYELEWLMDFVPEQQQQQLQQDSLPINSYNDQVIVAGVTTNSQDQDQPSQDTTLVQKQNTGNESLKIVSASMSADGQQDGEDSDQKYYSPSELTVKSEDYHTVAGSPLKQHFEAPVVSGHSDDNDERHEDSAQDGEYQDDDDAFRLRHFDDLSMTAVTVYKTPMLPYVPSSQAGTYEEVTYSTYSEQDQISKLYNVQRPLSYNPAKIMNRELKLGMYVARLQKQCKQLHQLIASREILRVFGIGRGIIDVTSYTGSYNVESTGRSRSDVEQAIASDGVEAKLLQSLSNGTLYSSLSVNGMNNIDGSYQLQQQLQRLDSAVVWSPELCSLLFSLDPACIVIDQNGDAFCDLLDKKLELASNQSRQLVKLPPPSNICVQVPSLPEKLTELILQDQNQMFSVPGMGMDQSPSQLFQSSIPRFDKLNPKLAQRIDLNWWCSFKFTVLEIVKCYAYGSAIKHGVKISDSNNSETAGETVHSITAAGKLPGSMSSLTLSSKISGSGGLSGKPNKLQKSPAQRKAYSVRHKMGSVTLQATKQHSSEGIPPLILKQ
ncbi:hypothetical protein MP228_002677 [Amoeboaphelidium protococcarum]|nr:hypothetical protein MP228_002677 [Amoeboaphelidium protococcarum]